MAKHSIELTETAHAFARRKVAAGDYPSIDAVLEAGLSSMMEEEAMVSASLEQNRELILERIATPREEFLPWDGDKLLADLKIRREAKLRGDDAT